jgi:hypothetical protein
MAFRASAGELANPGAFTFRLTKGLIGRHHEARMSKTKLGTKLVPDKCLSLLTIAIVVGRNVVF